MVDIISVPLILLTYKVSESVDEQPVGVVIFNPIIVGEDTDCWSNLMLYLLNKTLPETAEARQVDR